VIATQAQSLVLAVLSTQLKARKSNLRRKIVPPLVGAFTSIIQLQVRFSSLSLSLSLSLSVQLRCMHKANQVLSKSCLDAFHAEGVKNI